MKKIKRIMLVQPNYSILGKRTWKMPPYNLAILKACLKEYHVFLYDPNFSDEKEADIRKKLQDAKPDLVGITSFSTEYIEEVMYHTKLIKQELSDTVVVLGGVLPTVWIDKIIQDENADYFIMGEGEYRFRELLKSLEGGAQNNGDVDGISFRKNGKLVINSPKYFIDDLDSIAFPDWGKLDYLSYSNHRTKYSHALLPRQFPFATTITSRGCPYKCIFCAAKTVSGTKVRMRSSQNVLEEIEWYRKEYDIKEMIFLDDHFLHNRKRATEIINGLIEREYGLTWKCANVAIFSLDEQMLDLMKRSGSYQLTVSIESGDQDVVSKLIKKPVNLERAKATIELAKAYEFEIIANFVIGTPGETWNQIRRSLAYASSLDVDIVNIHIATPLPKTELMDICIREGIFESEDGLMGYTEGQISTEEFHPFELKILRAFEWDRINFSSQEKLNKVARMSGLTIEEAQEWRKSTRRNLGSTIGWKNRFEN